MNGTIYNEVIVEFIPFLTDDAFAYVKEMAGFPPSWTRIHVSNWLGHNYDRITIRSLCDNNGEPDLNSLDVVNPYTYHDERYLVDIVIPFHGVHYTLLNYVLNLLLNVNFDDWADYFNYITSNGRCYLNICIHRYGYGDDY